MDREPFVLCDNLVKIYKVADLEAVALQGLDLEVAAGEIVALMGPSGAGKSTLLNVIGGLDVPSAGGVWVAGHDLLQMNAQDRVAYKREVVGFMWQNPARNLLPYLSACENVELPMVLSRVKGRERRRRALEILEVLGMSDRANFRPDRLSGGQQQRVALAVAMANRPPLLLGDEITGQIDSETAGEVFEALRRINQAFGTTILVVTHDPLVASRVDRVMGIRDGRTSTEIRRHFDVERGMLHEEEWVVLDRVGRLQIPSAYVDTLAMQELVRVRLEEDHVSVWPKEAVRRQAPARPAAERAASPVEPDAPTAIEVEGLSRVFDLGVEQIHAVHDVSFAVPQGSLAVVKGPSGSGKTTLLNLIAGLDDPTAGEVLVDGRAWDAMSAREHLDLRRCRFGFVYQTFGLLPFLSAAENVEVPLRMVGTAPRKRAARVGEVLEMVGLSERAGHRMYELSGGEQQRVALARALANRPSILLADEPTGQLDATTGASIIALIRSVIAETGITVIVASHDPSVAEAADWVYELSDGKLVRAYRQVEVDGAGIAGDSHP
jgi:peptide/nickel transport system ATP-binding protein